MGEAIARFEQALPRAAKDFRREPRAARRDARHRPPAQGRDGQRPLPRRPAIAACCADAPDARRPARRAHGDRLLHAGARAPARRRRADLAAEPRAHGRRVVSGGCAGGEPDPAVGVRSRPRASAGSPTSPPALGVDSFSSAGGVIVDDFDNDGALEILTSNFDSCGRMQLFRRGADGRFHDEAARAGLAGELGGLNLLQADYDNDGCKDVLVLRGGWETSQRKSLLRNNCDGTFTDGRSRAAWPARRPARRRRRGPTSTTTASSISSSATRTIRRSCFATAATAPSRTSAPPPAWRARRSPRAWRPPTSTTTATWTSTCPIWAAATSSIATTATAPLPRSRTRPACPGPERGFPTWFFDYDNDGWDDLLVSSYFLSVDETARRYLRRPPNAGTMKLYRNRGNGTFADVTAQAGLDRVYMPMGSNFGDVDNDGYPDIYLGSGSPSYAAAVGSVLLHNQRGPRVRGRHRLVGHGRTAQGTRRRVRGHRRRRRSRHRVQGGRRHAGRRARVPPVRQPGPRPRLARARSRGHARPTARPSAPASP